MKPNIWVSSAQASELLIKQRKTWPLAEKNYLALQTVQVKEFDFGHFTIKVQFNPSRIISSGAKIDAKSIRERLCFLCSENLPIEQERLPFGSHYLVLCNPYPILPRHFTIPTREHTRQEIRNRIQDFLELTYRMQPYTLFYNGPKCGASAPDHAHFQAGTRGTMPMDNEIDTYINPENCIISESNGSLYKLTGYLRNGFIIKAKNSNTAITLFDRVYQALEIPEDEYEPRINLFCTYQKGEWVLTLIPRRLHRPWQYFAEGEDLFLSSPGGADIGGLFITTRKEDFDKTTKDLLQDIYTQVCLNDKDIEELTIKIAAKDI